MNQNELRTFLHALQFAAMKHRTQTRKGIDKTPYINHLIDVARIRADCGVTDAALLTAAVLHDAKEDQDVTLEFIAAEFGADVAHLVGEVTDDKSLPKEVRKQLQVEGAPKKSDRGKQLKIADKISNVREVAAAPPADWSLTRRQEYLDWAERVVAGCRGINPNLDNLFDQTLEEARATLTQ
jgi:(p)ppGpp synthase/HD superfamily hydrolase